MGIGDAVIHIQSIVSIGSLFFRPAVGVDMLIKGAYGNIIIGTPPNSACDIDLEIFSWVTSGTMVIVRSDQTINQWINIGVFVNNDNQLQVHNRNASTQEVGYYGIQTK